MGVDSGLPDFRGVQGFWRAYPPYARLGLGFADLADPRRFRDVPALAWGFYGHRLRPYRRTRPHRGFALLVRWAARMPRCGFVSTSSVGGQFQRAGFGPDRVIEAHGSIHRRGVRRRAGSERSRPTRTRSRWTRRRCGRKGRYRGAPGAARWPGPTS
jgi:NAD-dependent SIR2 family protein deacetylase